MQKKDIYIYVCIYPAMGLNSTTTVLLGECLWH